MHAVTVLTKRICIQVTVLGEVKIVGLLILSAMILPGESSQFTAKMTVGCVLAMLGFCLYSNTKLVMARRAAAGQGQPAKQAKQGEDMEEGQALLQVRSTRALVTEGLTAHIYLLLQLHIQAWQS